jgi:hypothetical protein
VKRHCAICGIAIRWRSDGLCHRCYKEWVKKKDAKYPDEYPFWLVELIRSYNKETFAEYRRMPHESSYGLFEDLADSEEFSASYFG